MNQINLKAILLCVAMAALTLLGQTRGVFQFAKVNGSDVLLNMGDTAKIYTEIEFEFSEDLAQSAVEIWKNDKKTIATLTNGKLIKNGSRPEDIAPDQNGVFRITVNGQGKIMQCSDDCDPAPAHFLIKLNNKFYGGFHLKKGNKQDDEDPSTNGKIYEPGYLLYDAIYLNRYRNDGTKADTLAMILKHYGVDIDSGTNNVYLKDIVKALKQNKQKGVHGGEPVGSLSAAGMLSSIGGLDVTTLADGFARFIVKRTKQELSIAFFDNFKTQLDTYPDFKSLFPQTNRSLQAIDKQIYLYEAYLQTLREAFENDLAALPSALPAIIENHKDFFDKMPALKATLQSGFYLAQSIQEGSHPGVVIAEYPTEILDSLDINIKGGFQAFQMFSQAFKSNKEEEGHYWAPYADIKKVFEAKDDKLLHMFMGLLEQRAKEANITFKDSRNNTVMLYRLIDTAYYGTTAIYKYRSYIRTLSMKIKMLEKQIADLNNAANDSVRFEQYIAVVNQSVSFMRYLVDVETLPFFPSDIHLKEKTKIFFDVAETSSVIAADVNRRHYASAIVNTVHLYNLIFNEENLTVLAGNAIAVSGLSDKNAQKKANKATENSIENYKQTAENIFRYGSFMAAMVQAKSSEQVSEVIETFALPVGSARIKRESPLNVSLNAYCGLFYGAERIQGADKGPYKFNSFGVTAPIGISISKGQQYILPWVTNRKGQWSHSVFLSIVDIGAITAFRFLDDSTESVPEIQLKNIISPGIFYSLGIPKSPISVNVGWQMGPLLRKVTTSSNTIGSSYSRFSIGLTVDLPLLNLYTKSRR